MFSEQSVIVNTIPFTVRHRSVSVSARRDPAPVLTHGSTEDIGSMKRRRTLARLYSRAYESGKVFS